MNKTYITLLLFFISICNYANTYEVKNILLLNSYHTGFKWTDDITDGVIDGIGKNSEYRIFVEYMDYKRFQNKEFFFELEKLYKYKYKTQDIDGIICADNYAFEFFLEKGDSLWSSNIPVTFCGVNNIDDINYDKDRFKGVREDIDVINTLDVVLNNHPDLESLILISDNTLSGEIFLNQFLEELKIHHPNIPYRTIDATDYSKLKNELSQLPDKEHVIILLSLYSNKHSIPVEMLYFGREILANKNIPIYSFWDFLLNDFIVGGSMISSYNQGLKAATMLKSLIEAPNKTIEALAETQHQYKFDYNILIRHGIDIENLPFTSEIINQDIPFWLRFKSQIILATITLIILIFTNLVLISNIIKRKNTELKLLESEERLELAINSANEGLWDISLNKQHIVINNNLAKLLGYSTVFEANLTFDNWESFIYAEDLSQLKEAYLLHTRNANSIFKSEIRLIKNDNSLIWCLLHGKITEYSLKGEPIRITGVIIDNSSQKEFEEQLKLAKNKAEESDRLKSSFLANMSHEIRTPMNAIIGFSDILTEQEISNEEQHTYLYQVKHSAEKLLNIINDIVDISKIESGQLSIKNEVFNVQSLIENLKITGHSLLKEKQDVQLLVEHDKRLRGFDIYCDPYRLEQVLLNLLSNAIKFTDEGYVKILYKMIGNESISFEISDTGEGIAPEDQIIIFERFRQVDATSKKLLSGTGLGLSISKSLTLLMNGTIEVTSEINAGSTFSVTLPLILVPQRNQLQN